MNTKLQILNQFILKNLKLLILRIFKSELNSTELINWSDIIITYPTSINIEAIIKNKYTILTNYIKVHIENQNSWFSKFKIIENVKDNY